MLKEKKEEPLELIEKNEFLDNALSQVINDAIFTSMMPVVIGTEIFTGPQLFKLEKLMNTVRPYLDACYRQGVLEQKHFDREIDRILKEDKDAKSRDTSRSNKQDDTGGATPKDKRDPSRKNPTRKEEGSFEKSEQTKNEEPEKSH